MSYHGVNVVKVGLIKKCPGKCLKFRWILADIKFIKTSCGYFAKG